MLNFFVWLYIYICGASNRGRKRKSGIYACQVVKEGSSFKSNQTGEIYKIRQDINCRSENIIYLVTCKKCGMQGVGSCTTFCKRISNYVTSIENKSPGCRIEMHFLKPEHSVQDFTITGIVQLVNPPRDPIGRLREFEGYWMIKLQTLEPYRWYQEALHLIGCLFLLHSFSPDKICVN